MFLAIAIVVLILWALGAFIVPVGSAFIHLLLVLAAIAIVVHFVSGRRTV